MRQVLLAVSNDLFASRLRHWLQCNESRDFFTQVWMRDADNRSLTDRRMRQQNRLDLLRKNRVPSSENSFTLSSHKPDEAAGQNNTKIARAVPAFVKDLACLIGMIQIALHR